MYKGTKNPNIDPTREKVHTFFIGITPGITVTNAPAEFTKFKNFSFGKINCKLSLNL